MDRKDFLITIWKKGFVPILLLAMIYFCSKFLYNIFAENGTERFFTISILGLGLFFAIAYFTGLVFKSLISKINSKLPESVLPWIKRTGKILDFIAPIILGGILYHFWQEDWKLAAFTISILLVQQIKEILNEEKQAKRTIKK